MRNFQPDVLTKRKYQQTRKSTQLALYRFRTVGCGLVLYGGVKASKQLTPSLRKIKSTHQVQRPHVCPICPGSYAFSNGLRRHNDIVHVVR